MDAAAMAAAERRMQDGIQHAQRELVFARRDVANAPASVRADAAAMEARRQRVRAAVDALWAAEAEQERWEVDRAAMSDERRAREQAETDRREAEERVKARSDEAS